MIIIDRMLVGGIKFVLGKIATSVEAELNDDRALREELLAAQMRLELGEISEEDFRALEEDLLDRLREIRREQLRTGGSTDLSGVARGEQRITGVEAEIYGDE